MDRGVGTPRPVSGLRTLISTNAIDPIDSDQVIVDRVHDPVPADAQPVVSAPVKRLWRKRISGKGRDSGAHGTHAILVMHIPAR
jgi:hypothetical protein